MIEFSVNELMTFLFVTGIKVAALISTAAICLVFVRRLASRDRAFIWFLVIVVCGAVPLLSVVVPNVELSLPIKNEWIPQNETSILASDVNAEPASFSTPSVWEVVALAYLLGVCVALTRMLIQIRRLAALGRAGVEANDRRGQELLADVLERFGGNRNVRLVFLRSIQSPITWGSVRPCIAMPLDSINWPIGRLRNALVHEVAHIRRNDWSRLCLMKLSYAIHWFNPLVIWAVRQCTYETERACDEYVVQSGTLRSDYAQQLIDTMRTCKRGAGVQGGLALGRLTLANRIRELLSPRGRELVMRRAHTSVVILAVLALGTLLSICQVSSGKELVGEDSIAFAVSGDDIRNLAPEGITIVQVDHATGGGIHVVARRTSANALGAFMEAVRLSGMENISIFGERSEEEVHAQGVRFEMMALPR